MLGVDGALAQHPPANPPPREEAGAGAGGLCQGARAVRVAARRHVCLRKSALQDRAGSPCWDRSKAPRVSSVAPPGGLPIPEVLGRPPGSVGSLLLPSERPELPGICRAPVPGPRGGSRQPRTVLPGQGRWAAPRVPAAKPGRHQPLQPLQPPQPRAQQRL